MKFNERSGIEILSYVEIQIVNLLKANDNLNQKAITQKLSSINKSNISRSLKRLKDKDIIREQLDGTYQYRYGNQYFFKNPDKVLNDLIKQLYYMPIDFEPSEVKNRVLLKDNWTYDQISNWREAKVKMGVTEDDLVNYLEEDEKKQKIFWEKVKEVMNTPPKYSPPDHNGIRHLLDENGEIIKVNEVDEVGELLKKLKELKEK